MAMILTLKREGDLLRATVLGEFSLEQAKKNFLEVLDAAVLYDSRRVLFDGRCVTGFPDGPDRYFYGEFAAHSLWDRIARGLVGRPPTFAFVLSPPVLDPERFGMKVAQNRGMRVKAFDNLEDAMAWLGPEQNGTNDSVQRSEPPPA
jgi:hypothetical protein